jgi:hypothetical protein
MKVLFLDHDGVICLYKNWGSRFGKTVGDDVDLKTDDFDSQCIQTLNEIIEITGCEIVVSSDWRDEFSLNELGQLYKIRGILKAPIDVTGSYNDIIRINGYPDYVVTQSKYIYITPSVNRIVEINHYVDTHPEIESYCVVDDMNLQLGKVGVKNFIRTVPNLGIKKVGIKEKIVKLLNKQK